MGRSGRRVTHRIHLRGFWDVTEPEPGRVRFARRFGKPTSSPEQKLSLVVESKQSVLRVEINGELLADDSSSGRFSILNLQSRNVVKIELAGNAKVLPPDVAIEIEDS